MASTILVGDHVLVERASLAPATSWAPFLRYDEVHRRDIIVFYKPVIDPSGEHTPLVKRVIGIPGDRIHLRNGIVYLNGVAQNEPWAAQPTAANYNPFIDDFPAISPSPDLGATAAWSVAIPQSSTMATSKSSRQLLCHRRQSPELARQPLLGLRPPAKHRRTSPVRLLVHRNPGVRRRYPIAIRKR